MTKIGFFLSIFSINWNKLKLSKLFIIFLILYLFFIFILQIIGQDFIVVNRISFCILGLLIIRLWNDEQVFLFINIISIFLLILLIGALLGELYSINGLPGIPIFVNPDDSIVMLYLTTLATTRYDSVIRASGIYDEAGALTFIIWVVIIIRELYYKESKLNFLFVVFGFFTFSFIHVFLSLIFFISKIKSLLNLRTLIIILISIVVIFGVTNNVDLTKFYDRFIIQDGKFSGDNRSDEIVAFFENINLKIFFLGDENTKHGFSFINYSANPFNPIWNNGIIASFPFYVILLYCSYALIFKSNKTLWLIFLLLILQRPYLFTFGYSYLIIIVFTCLYKSNNLKHYNL
jgi:hypothetical protein